MAGDRPLATAGHDQGTKKPPLAWDVITFSTAAIEAVAIAGWTPPGNRHRYT
jgi:hypothetical protein